MKIQNKSAIYTASFLDPRFKTEYRTVKNFGGKKFGKIAFLKHW